MSSMLRRSKNRLRYSNRRNSSSTDNEFRTILEQLLYENRLLNTRFDQLEERNQQWINDERIYLLKRIEKLEKDKHQLHDIYQTYQNQDENSIRSITNLIIKILVTQQELRKQHIERHNANDTVQWRKKRQQDETITQNTRSLPCHFDFDPLNPNQSPMNDQSIWFHQAKEQDQQTRNYSLELNHHSSTLATIKSKSDKPLPALSNKLYYVLNNEKTPSKSTRDTHRSTGINITPVDDSNVILQRKQQQSSITQNKNQSQTTRSTYSNHERLPTQTSSRPAPVVKKAPTTSLSKPPRVPTTTVRPTTTNIRPRAPLPPPTTNQKTVPTTNKSSRLRSTLPKPVEPARPTRPRSGQTATNKPNISPPKNIKTRIPIIPAQFTRVTDLDTAMAEQKKQKIISPVLFSTNTVKLVRPVRSQELKIFSSHLIPEISFPTNESLSTLTVSSFQSTTEEEKKKTSYKNSSSNLSTVGRDFSADSLNEHSHLQKLLQPSSGQTTTIGNIQLSLHSTSRDTEGYFLSTDDHLNPPYAPASSLIKPKSIPSLVHRLVFPARLGHLIFSRRILSDSDIYQKICSKDNEICHHVYHLDTIRDYSMEFYMLTTYASDSQLRAWLDDDDYDEIIGHFNENRFLSSEEEEINKNPVQKRNNSDSLLKEEEEELDWYSEVELFNSTKEKQGNTSSNSSEIHMGKFSSTQQLFTDATSVSWTIPLGTSNQLHSTPLSSDITDASNSILREILNHSWTDPLSPSNSIQHETGIEQFENDSTSSIIADEFQADFYYLCPMTKTTSFTKIDEKI